MQCYGYILSNLARHDRFNEAEQLLDLILRGYSKGNKRFEADGSITMIYSKEEPDGEKKVTLRRNVTESCIMVMSDIPLKLLRLGGWIFYLRDLIPTLAFFLLYSIWGVRFNSMMILSGNSFRMAGAIIAGAFAALLINLISGLLLKKNRSFDRVCFIQFGGIFSLVYILAVMINYSGTGIWLFWTWVLAFSPFIEAVGGLLLTRFVHIFSREDG